MSASGLASDKGAIQALEARFATVIENDIRFAFAQAQDLGSDFLGLGNAIYRLQPQEWRRLEAEWTEHLSQLELDFDIEAKITVTGLIKEPIRIK